MKKSRSFSLTTAYFWLIAFLLYLPLFLLILFSFNDSTMLSFPLKGFTLHWYREAFQTRQMIRALGNSLGVAAGSAAVATGLGFMGALALVRFRFPGKKLFITVAAMPLVVPYVVLGVALLLAFHAVNIPMSLWSVGVAHVVICLPESMIMIAARIYDFPSSLEEAAMDLGASYWETLLRVTIPISAPALLASFLTCFTISFNEFAVSLFVIGSKATLPIYIFSQLRISQRVPMVIALSAVAMIASVLLLIFAEWVRHYGIRKIQKDVV